MSSYETYIIVKIIVKAIIEQQEHGQICPETMKRLKDALESKY